MRTEGEHARPTRGHGVEARRLLAALALLLVGAAPPAVIVVDPGHDPTDPGALGTTGTFEVEYNDRLARRVVALLRDDPRLVVHLSRDGDGALSLGARARRIASLAPTLVVSLHHDSVKPQHLTWREQDGVSLPTCAQHRGFSIFAQARGPHTDRSRRLARAIADEYARLGLRHTTYHAQPIPGEGRRWIDAERGIHAGDYLHLLRTIDAPVVLVESGFVVNPDDEAALRDPEHLERLAAAIATAVREVALGRK